MLSKRQWTGGVHAPTAERLRSAASDQQLATKSNPNGTATLTSAITLANTESVAAEDVRLVLVRGLGLPVMRGEKNVLAVGAPAAGQRVTLTWPITVLAPVAVTHVMLIVIHAGELAVGGTIPVNTGARADT